jgi:hypothetical protein
LLVLVVLVMRVTEAVRTATAHSSAHWWALLVVVVEAETSVHLTLVALVVVVLVKLAAAMALVKQVLRLHTVQTRLLAMLVEHRLVLVVMVLAAVEQVALAQIATLVAPMVAKVETE